MKREDLKKNIKEKMLFEGPTATGKTHTLLIIAAIYAISGKKVLFIDPEGGSDKEKYKILNKLTDKQLENIELIQATNIEMYLKYMLGWTEERIVGPQKMIIQHGLDDCDAKICDGLGNEIEQYKTRLSRKFQDQGYYEIGGKQFNITNKETFVLPYQFYGKLYDQIKEALVIMLDHKYDIFASIHPLKKTDSQMELQQQIYQKFDSVTSLNKHLNPLDGCPIWDGKVIKNRGRESPNVSNKLDSIDPIIIYFINKFGLNKEETLEKFDMIIKED